MELAANLQHALRTNISNQGYSAAHHHVFQRGFDHGYALGFASAVEQYVQMPYPPLPNLLKSASAEKS